MSSTQSKLDIIGNWKTWASEIKDIVDRLLLYNSSTVPVSTPPSTSIEPDMNIQYKRLAIKREHM